MWLKCLFAVEIVDISTACSNELELAVVLDFSRWVCPAAVASRRWLFSRDGRSWARFPENSMLKLD